MSVDRRMCQQVIAELWGDGAWVTTIATDDPGLGEVRWVPATASGIALPDLFGRLDDAVPLLVADALVPVTDLVAHFLSGLLAPQVGPGPHVPVLMTVIHPDAMSVAARREIAGALRDTARVRWVARGSLLVAASPTAMSGSVREGQDDSSEATADPAVAVLTVDVDALEASIWSVADRRCLITRLRRTHPGRRVDDSIRQGLSRALTRTCPDAPTQVSRAHARAARSALAVDPATEIVIDGDQVRVLRTEVRDWVQDVVSDQFDALASAVAALPQTITVQHLVIAGPYAHLPGLVELASDRFGIPVTATDRVLGDDQIPDALWAAPAERDERDEQGSQSELILRRHLVAARRRPSAVRSLVRTGPRAALVATVAAVSLSGLAAAAPRTADAALGGPRSLAERLFSGALGDLIPEQALPVLLPPVVAGASVLSTDVMELVKGVPDRRDVEAEGGRQAGNAGGAGATSGTGAGQNQSTGQPSNAGIVGNGVNGNTASGNGNATNQGSGNSASSGGTGTASPGSSGTPAPGPSTTSTPDPTPATTSPGDPDAHPERPWAALREHGWRGRG